jgi:hypothetical protein
MGVNVRIVFGHSGVVVDTAVAKISDIVVENLVSWSLYEAGQDASQYSQQSIGGRWGEKCLLA